MLQCSELIEGDAVSKGCCGSPGEVCCRPRAGKCGDMRLVGLRSDMR